MVRRADESPSSAPPPCDTCADDVAASRCRVCGRAGMSSVLCLGRAPLANEFVRAQDAPSPRYPLHVMHCDGCLLAQLASGVPPQRLFEEYAYFSSASAPLVDNGRRLRGFVRATVRPPAAGLVVEIGSNDGYLLRDYAADGHPVLGIDPARNVALAARAAGVPTLTEYFTTDLAGRIRAGHGPAAVVHANNVLAHVPDITDVLGGLRTLVDGGGAVVIETPSIVDIVRRGLFDTVYHEHVYYYSFTALSRLLAAAGLTAVDVHPTDAHGGSMRVVARCGAAPVAASVPRTLAAEQAAGVADPDFYAGFAARVNGFLTELRDDLAGLAADGHRLAGFGAAAKAAIMVSATDAPLAYVCDSTPYKQDRMLPGTGIPIVAPQRLTTDPPDHCVILAWNYADRIIADNRDYLARGGTFVTAVDLRVRYVRADG